MMNFHAPLNAVVVAYVSLAESSPIDDLGPFERIVSYIGVLALGWFFWRRETNRTDETVEDLKTENKLLRRDIKDLENLLRRDIKDLENDIRELLSNRQGKRYTLRSRDRSYFEDLDEEGLDDSPEDKE
ncbi:hypothetical protein KC887_02265 [Candidatus Kaiserbacteria bacterium]|nr:hypothetical protein [Candidatus Kaiserbacteria bacterium]